MSDKPEQILTRLFLSMFSAEELRRLIRFGFPDELSQALPGPTASPAAVAEAVSLALLDRNELDALWPRLLAERPRRQGEIDAARVRIAEFLASGGSGDSSGSSRGPIRILFVLACPKTQERIATDEEIRQIRDELASAQHRDRFTHEVVLAATYNHLRKALRRHKPHILHIACHGTDDAQLVLDDGNQGEELIEAETFVDLLDVLKEDLRLVILNACHSTSITRKIAPLVNLVIGMRGAVEDNSAVAFSQVFYESIASGDTVEQSFRLGINELKRRKAEIHVPELLPADGPQRLHRFVTP